jgi:uncharacterized membrane protein YtjA (UPF0391 family)
LSNWYGLSLKTKPPDESGQDATLSTPEPKQSPSSAEEIRAQYAATKDLRGLTLDDGDYASIGSLNGANLESCSLFRTIFQSADLSGAKLRGVQAERMVCIGTTFTGADLGNADLNNTDFSSATLTNADLRGSNLQGCNFTGANVSGMRIDRRGLRQLGAEYGGLTVADISSLRIDDPRAELATGFGGIWGVSHLLAAILFILPYLIFLLRTYLAALATPCAEGETCEKLRDLLWLYIKTGGRGEGTDWLALLLFSLLLVYTVFRLSLVAKEHQLSVQEQATGIPIDFRFEGYWSVARGGCKPLAVLSLLLACLKAWEFLAVEVPVSAASMAGLA